MKRKTLFYHGETIDGYRFTIAGQFQPMPRDGDDQSIDVIRLGASLCSPEDQFVKKLGRKKAEGRMNSNVMLKGRNYFDLYKEAKPEGWFKDKEINVFIDIVKFYDLISSSLFKENFHL